VAVYVRVIPNESFQRRLASIIRSEYAPHSELLPPRNLRSFFRGWWGSRTTPGESKKRDEIQSTILTLKESTRRHLQRYFSGLIFRPGFMLPSIELWTKIEPSPSQDESDSGKPPFKTFWDSVGFPTKSSEKYEEPS